MTTDPRRHVPRLSFAGRPAPVLQVGGDHCEVLDLSSDGLRFRDRRVSSRLTLGEVLRGVIWFPADRSIEIEGRVVRVQEDEAALQLARGREAIAFPAPAGPVPARRFGLQW